MLTWFHSSSYLVPNKLYSGTVLSYYSIFQSEFAPVESLHFILFHGIHFHFSKCGGGWRIPKPRGIYSDCDGHKKCTHSLTDTIQLEFGTFPQFLPPGTGIYGQPFIGFRSVSIRSLHCTLQHHITYFILLPVVVAALLFHFTTTTRPVGIDSEFINQSAP